MKNAQIFLVAFVLLSISFIRCENKEKDNSNDQIDLKESENYKLAMDYLQQGNLNSFNNAIDKFNLIIKEHPDFSPAYIGLAKTYMNLGPNFNILSPEQTNKYAINAINKALSIDDTSKEVLLSFASVKINCEWDWQAADDTYKKALKLYPENQNVIGSYADFLNVMGKKDEALDLINSLETTQENEFRTFLAYLNDDYEFQINNLNKQIETDSTAGYKNWRLAILYSRVGEHEKAIMALDKQMAAMEGDIDDELALKGYNLGKLNMVEEANEILAKFDELERNNEYVSPALKAWIYCGLGDKESAIAHLEKSIESHAHRAGLGLKNFNFIFSDLKDNPQFVEIEKNISLSI